MDRVCMLRFCQLPGCAVHGIKIVRGIDMNPGNQLLLPIADKAKAFHHVAVQVRAAHCVDATIRIQKMQRLVFRNHGK